MEIISNFDSTYACYQKGKFFRIELSYQTDHVNIFLEHFENLNSDVFHMNPFRMIDLGET